MGDSNPDFDLDIPVDVDEDELSEGDRSTPIHPVPRITPLPPPKTPVPGLSREEQDSIRALADTSDETEKLAKSLYKMIAADPQGARTRSSDKLRAVRVPVITETPEKAPIPSKGEG